MEKELEFNSNGLLPAGDYPMTLAQLADSILVDKPFYGRSDGWEGKHRKELVSNLSVIVKQLWNEGFYELFIDGSFATDKLKPGDIDGYFVTEKPADMLDSDFNESLCERLNKHDPKKVWTWKDSARKKPADAEKGQLPMWWEYKVEFWPHYGQSSGIFNPNTGKFLDHAELFRIVKGTWQEKGIIKILKD